MSIKALKAFNNAISTAHDIASKNVPIGKSFRGASEFAKHVVYVDKNELKHELADLIYRSLGYDSSAGKFNYDLGVATDTSVEHYVFEDRDLTVLTNIVYKNLKDAFNDIKKRFTNSEINITDQGSKFMVSIFTGKNNYAIIGEAFSKAWEGRGQYGGLKQFIINNLSPESALYKGIEDKTERTKTGLDRGHGESASNDISNIENFINVIGINSIKDAYGYENLKELSKEELDKIEKDLRTTFGNETALRELWALLYRNGKTSISRFDTFEKLINTYIDSSITLFRKIETDKIHIQLKVEGKVTDLAGLEKLAKDIVVAIRPQSSLANQAFGGIVQRELGKLFEKQNKDLFTFIDMWISGKSSGLGKGQQFPESLLKMQGSDSMEDMIVSSLRKSMTTGIKDKKQISSTQTNKSNPAKVSIKKLYDIVNVGNFVKKKAVEAKKISRNWKQAPNIINIVNMINMQLAETIRQNMGSPRLNYRTGRFANSAKVLPASMESGGILRLPYTYMKYPYQTFEVGYARGTPARDPRKVISESIRELAIRLVLIKLRVIRI